MPDDRPDPLSARWRDALARIGRRREAASSLEARVRASLAAQHRNMTSTLRSSRRAWLTVAAVTMAGFIVVLARWQPWVREPSGDGLRFLLLLYEGSRYDPRGASPAQLIGEYRAWAEQLAERGKLVDASELSPEEHLVSGAGESTRGAAGTITGFFIIRAADQTEAAAIAATCPHLTYGGEVAVRPLRGT